MTARPVFRIHPARPLGAEVIRILDETGGRVTGHLEHREGDHGTSLHEARKGIKKLRALLLLVRGADKPLMIEEERRLRDAARLIAGPREATAAIETVDRFIAAFPEKVEACHLAEIRDALDARHARIAGQALDEARGDAAAMCRTALGGLRRGDHFSGRDGGDVLATGFGKASKHWRKALRRARRRGDPEAFHELRKSVKAHWAQLGLLRDFGNSKVKKRRTKVEALGELLGEINDIHVMRAALAGRALDLPEAIDTKPFDKLLKKHASALSKEALPQADRLLETASGKQQRRLRKSIAKAT